MSKYVLVSDIHGNYPALQAVIDREGRDANYLILGDLFGLNAYPKKTLELLLSLENARVLRGNHDTAIFHHNEGHVASDKLSEFELENTLADLSEAETEWVKELPSFCEITDSEGQKICLTHAKPWPSESSGYEARNAGIPKGNVPHFASKVSDKYDYVFHGHTHDQYSLDCSQWSHDVQFVNPGSLGYDYTYSVIDTETGEVGAKSVEVDVDEIKDHIQENLPEGAPHVSSWY